MSTLDAVRKLLGRERELHARDEKIARFVALGQELLGSEAVSVYPMWEDGMGGIVLARVDADGSPRYRLLTFLERLITDWEAEEALPSRAGAS